MKQGVAISVESLELEMELRDCISPSKVIPIIFLH